MQATEKFALPAAMDFDLSSERFTWVGSWHKPAVRLH
jgi:hypothetical protein